MRRFRNKCATNVASRFAASAREDSGFRALEKSQIDFRCDAEKRQRNSLQIEHAGSRRHVAQAMHQSDGRNSYDKYNPNPGDCFYCGRDFKWGLLVRRIKQARLCQCSFAEDRIAPTRA